MPSRWPTGSLLHPTYGSAARDIRSAVGISRDEQAARLARQLDGVRRAIVLRDRDWRGLIITGGDHEGVRVTPDHKKFTGIYSPDLTVIFEAGRHPHEIALRVDTALTCSEIAECIKAALLADTAWLDEICDYCDTSTPPDPWPGGG